MKRAIAWILAATALLGSGLAFGAAKAVNVSGAVSAQVGSGPARTIREGDTVNAKDIVVTGPASTVVLRFDDGEIASLGQNSRMSIDAYDYNAQAKSGNIFLNLFVGGMRAVTGLIGRNSPQNVAYKAATATIGIRGTDVAIATEGGETVVSVLEGAASVRVGNQTVPVPAGDAIYIRKDGTFVEGPLGTIMDLIKGTALARELSSVLPQTIPNGATVPGTSYTPGNNSGPGGGGGGGTASGG
jgi:hypothetical protein